MSQLEMSMMLNGLINGICLGWIYILIALGLTLILGIMQIMQFAHGEIYMVGAFIVYYLSVSLGLNHYAAILISMIAVVMLGLVLERFLLRPLAGQFLPSMCVTIGLSLILQTIVMLKFGLTVKHMPNFWPGTFQLLGVIIPKDRATAVFISFGLTLLIYILLKWTKYGQAVVASAQNREGAILQGISPNLMSAMVMAIGSALAAVGGSLAGGIFSLNPYMGSLALIKGITIIVIGGMGSFVGAVIGGLILGISDSMVAINLGSEEALIIPLVVIILILTIKHEGLFGHE